MPGRLRTNTFALLGVLGLSVATLSATEWSAAESSRRWWDEPAETSSTPAADTSEPPWSGDEDDFEDRNLSVVGFETADYESLEEPPWAETPAPAGILDRILPVSSEADFAEEAGACMVCDEQPWCHQVLPQGLLYRSYVAGEKESRFSSAWLSEKDRGLIWDASLGGRVGLWRYGTPGSIFANGWQVDMEGAALVRLDLDDQQDVDSTDYRFGIPITYRNGPTAYKFGYYHISSHVGDEWMIKYPTFERINYVRESAILGVSHHLNPETRVYGEVGYAVKRSGGAEPLELQFGAEYSPVVPTGRRPVPFAAVNIHLREEVDWGGSINTLAGYQWRGAQTNHVLRLGLQYFNGKSSQYSFFRWHEELIGFGMWFDY